MVPMAGIGPATSPLPRECSTTEPHGRLSFDHNLPQPFNPRLPNTNLASQVIQETQLSGAGDEARTRDIQFGKLKLYQLSYTRIAIKSTSTGLTATAYRTY